MNLELPARPKPDSTIVRPIIMPSFSKPLPESDASLAAICALICALLLSRSAG